jgi:hypothetical protein
MAPKVESIKGLLALLDNEERLYQRLVELTDQERNLIEKFKPTDLILASESRDQVVEEIAKAVALRREAEDRFLASRGGEPGENSTLTDIVRGYCTSDEKQVLEPRIIKFREIVGLARRKAGELGRLVSWAMATLGGSAAIVRSAGQDEVKGYTRKGSEVKRYHSKYGKNSNTLKEI